MPPRAAAAPNSRPLPPRPAPAGREGGGVARPAFAARAVGSWRLEGCALYVTLEPCPMCAGAVVQARLPLVVYGCADPKAGACDTLYRITQDARLNHRAQVVAGVLADRCADVLSRFFAD